MEQQLTLRQRRPSSGSGESGVDASTPPVRLGGEAAEFSEIGACDRLHPTSGYDLTACLGDLLLHLVGGRASPHHDLDAPSPMRDIKHLSLHGLHGGHVDVLGHSPQGDTWRRLEARRECNRLAHRDRLL
jgi:hypothetical protein